MEYEKLPCPGQGPGMCGSDREIFERVWRRVMPEETPACPITLNPPPKAAEETPTNTMPTPYAPVDTMTPAAAARPAVSDQATALMRPSPAMPPSVSADTSETGSDFPSESDVPYLGSASAIHGGQMQEFILRTLQSWRCYQLLSHRAGSVMKKLFSAMAADKRQQAKRLSTAYFLITGINYFPIERITAPPFNSYLGMLRKCFIEEQRESSDYLAAAEEINDPWLHSLYIDLARESTELAEDIRRALEQM